MSLTFTTFKKFLCNNSHTSKSNWSNLGSNSNVAILQYLQFHFSVNNAVGGVCLITVKKSP